MKLLLDTNGIPAGRSCQIDYSSDSRQSENRWMSLILNGRGERIRTSDPLVPNQVRYQTALRPEL
jgi:hypothetical protein